MSETLREIEELSEASYEYGFSTDLDTDIAPPGLTEDTVRLISAKKNEPEWLLDWRLKAFAAWKSMDEPDWAKLEINPIDYQALSYWAAPKQKPVLDSMDDVDPEIRDMFDKLGIPLHEQKMLSNVAIDAIVDSVSVTTTFKATLAEAGVIFCSFSEAVRDHPDLVREHLGSVLGDELHYGSVELVLVTLRRRAALEIRHVRVVFGDDQCALELPGVLRVDPEIGRQLHGAADSDRDVAERAVGEHR